MLKRTLFLSLCFIFSIAGYSQNKGWLSDLKLAQNASKSSNKLILVDFWATWCGPCKMMDSEVWSTDEAAIIKQNFIPVKIDIDNERSLAMKYNVRSIPMLILMDHNGEALYTYTGYQGKEDLLSFIRSIPSNATNLYKFLETEKKTEETFDRSFGLALALQEMGAQTSYASLQRSLLIQSDKYFKQSEKLATDETKKVEVELLSILNDVHRNSTKRALKTIEENRARYEVQPTQALLYFVLVKAYKKNGDSAGYDYALSRLKEREDGKKYLSMLE